MAWNQLGWQAQFYSEIEPFPCSVLAHHHPEVPNFGDMKKYKQWGAKRGAIDILVGGTPCQSFSVAGLRKGLDDPRGNLMLTYLAIADLYEPEIIVWENVPGVLSSNGGRDFGTFLGALAKLGYGWAYRVLDAQYFGVAQRRRRVFVIGCVGNAKRAAAILFERDCLQGYPAPSRETKKRVASLTANGVGTCGADDNQAQAGHLIGCWWDGGQISQTLDAVLYKGQTMPEKNRFPAVLQPMPTITKGDKHAVAVHVTQDPCVSYEKAFALGRNSGQENAISFHENQRGEITINNTIGALNSGGGKPGQGYPAIQQMMNVRRLTPRECERLQGFPDDYTLVPHRGKLAADSPRYKALGNSMAIPCMNWIGKRIQTTIDIGL